jgi:tRNA pseudouridine55 synthase
MIAGVLIVDKPQGLTSHDVVVAVRRVLGERRVGHSGTLDPMATGVLALAIGPATRLVQFLSGEVKQYDAVVRFGLETTTYDTTGEVVADTGRHPEPAAVAPALAAFRGTFPQIPPAYSAKQVGGMRAYTLARDRHAGRPVLAPVMVTVHDLTVSSYESGRAALTMTVSAGFYVRSLAHDLGQALGTGAVLEALRRTRSGRFTAEAAVPFADLVSGTRDTVAGHIVPMDRLLPDVPAMPLSSVEVRQVRHGRDVPLPPGWDESPPLVRLVDEASRLVALAVPGDRPGFLHPSVVLG